MLFDIFLFLFVDIVCSLTGELLLWIVTLGRRRFAVGDFNWHNGEHRFGELGTWVGMAFWCAIGCTIFC